MSEMQKLDNGVNKGSNKDLLASLPTLPQLSIVQRLSAERPEVADLLSKNPQALVASPDGSYKLSLNNLNLVFVDKNRFPASVQPGDKPTVLIRRTSGLDPSDHSQAVCDALAYACKGDLSKLS